MDQNRNASDEEYEEDYVYDDEEPEYNDNEGEDIGRNGSIGGSVISSRKQSFDSDTADYADAEDRKSLPALPLSEDEFDATVTEPAERNETVKRWVRIDERRNRKSSSSSSSLSLSVCIRIAWREHFDENENK